MTQPPRPAYQATSGGPLDVDQAFYGRIAAEIGRRTRVETFVVPIRSGRAWTVRAGQVCRIVAVDGPQVGDFNCWNLHDPRERFWAARTRQLHAAHVSTYDRLWSCLPYLRPMLTITADTIGYGVDRTSTSSSPERTSTTTATPTSSGRCCPTDSPSPTCTTS